MSRRTVKGGRFTAECLGRVFSFAQQDAAQQLSHPGRARALLPRLALHGLTGDAAYALAYNCVLLHQTLRGIDRLTCPAAALRRYSIGQIARLSECYFAHGDLPFDLPAEGEAWYDECAVNESYFDETADGWEEADTCKT